MIDVPDTSMVVQVKHHYKVDVPLAFLPPTLPIQLDLYLLETVSLDHFEADDDQVNLPDESGLTPFPYSQSYGQGSHLDEEGLEEEERAYFGCISNQWEHHISAPTNVVVGLSEVGSARIESHLKMSRPFGTDFDREHGSLHLNPDIHVERVIYCEETDPEWTFQFDNEDLTQEKNGKIEGDIREAYVHRMAEAFAANMASRTDLQFMHPEADRLYKEHVRRMLNPVPALPRTRPVNHPGNIYG